VARRPAVLAVAAAVVLVGPTLAGCASSSASGGGSGGTTSASSTAATKTITVSFTNGQVSPPPGRVDVPIGTHVHLVVTSDVAEEVHNHYDNQEKEIPDGGGTVTIDFVAEQPGVYEVELHHSDKLLLQLQVQ
jgi:hypothetical protein